MQERPGRLDGGRDDPLGRDDLDPGRGVEPPAQSRLGQERVEHDVLRLAGASWRRP